LYPGYILSGAGPVLSALKRLTDDALIDGMTAIINIRIPIPPIQ